MEFITLRIQNVGYQTFIFTRFSLEEGLANYTIMKLFEQNELLKEQFKKQISYKVSNVLE